MHSNIPSLGKARLFRKQSLNITDVTGGAHPRDLTAGEVAILVIPVNDSNQSSNRWNFACEHHIRLVDEFDQINFDIEPLLAVPQSMLQTRHRTLKKEMEDWGFQIRIANGKVHLEGGRHQNTSRAKDLAKLISGFASLVPDLEFSVSDHDRGNGILAADLRQYAHAAVLEKKSTLVFPDAPISLTSLTALTEQELEFHEDTNRHHDRRGLVHACSPDSAAVNLLATKEATSCESQRTCIGYSGLTLLQLAFRFIVDHNRTTMDFCVSPYLLDSHGSFAYNSAKSSRIVPMFVHCKDAQDSSLLLPALPGWKAFDRDRVINWEERISPKLFWRGRSTGCHFSRNSDWMCSVSSSCFYAKSPSIELVMSSNAFAYTSSLKQMTETWNCFCKTDREVDYVVTPFHKLWSTRRTLMSDLSALQSSARRRMGHVS